MDVNVIKYIEQQCFQVAPMPLKEEHYPYGFDLQISSYGLECERKTNWMRITPEQFHKIEQVLLGVI